MIEDLLKKRNNVSFFSKDKIPEKKQIEEILEKAHAFTPHKNNFWHYDLHVYGPEHEESKRNLAKSSVCNVHKDHYRQENVPDEDWGETREILPGLVGLLQRRHIKGLCDQGQMAFQPASDCSLHIGILSC